MSKLPIRRSKASDRSTASPVVLASSPPISAAQRKATPGKASGPSVRRAALLGHNVQRVASGLLQAKLTVGPVGDSYEREADSVASQVVSAIRSPSPAPAESGPDGGADSAPMAGPAPAMTAQRAAPEDELKKKPITGAVQRSGPEDELKKKPLAGAVQRGPEDELKMKPLAAAVQRGPEDELKKKPLPGAVQRMGPEDELKKKPVAGAVQREGGAMAGAEGGPVGADIERSIEGARSGGSALDPGLRAQMEPAFGADFSGVRVHSDAQSHSLNNSLQARAFTTGQDIFFRGGEYNPASQGGQELVAHELTHVVQQNGPGVAKKA